MDHKLKAEKYSSKKIAKFFNYQYLWKKSNDILVFASLQKVSI